MKALVLSFAVVAAASSVVAQSPVPLAEVTIFSDRVANQTSAGTFAMPVTALRYEPLVDIHPRNLAEGQADVTIRGGIFENTGFQLGAITAGDPQTGHYFAELPIAPAMLTAPRVLTGADLVPSAANATSGVVAYGWRPIKRVGALSLGAGENSLWRGELYQGATTTRGGGVVVGADVAVAHSESDGAVAYGEHRFDRLNGRVQLATKHGQTDLFAGYQAKFFGWPNLYTPFNSNETENLQTVLLGVNHRVDFGSGEFLEAGAFYRRNKDDYAFNRFAPLGSVHPFQHTTRLKGAAATLRRSVGDVVVTTRGEVSADALQSTSLTFGRFFARKSHRLSVVPEKAWSDGAGRKTTLRAGASYDDTNRDGAAISPVVELERTFAGAGLLRVYTSFTESTQTPTYTALNSSATGGLFRGNPNLGRQTSRNYEAGVSGDLAGWRTDAAVFWRRDAGLVDWTFRRGVIARTANAVDVDVAGAELVIRRSWKAAELVVGYTGLSKDADYRGAAVDASFYALNYAKHRLTMAVTLQLGQSFELRMDNAARLQADNLLRVVGGDEAILSAVGLIYRPRGLRRCELGVQVDNLWDTDFQDVPGVPAAPRQASLSVGYSW